MINPQWLELPVSRTNFHGPKDVQATEVRLYFIIVKYGEMFYNHHTTKAQAVVKVNRSNKE